MRLDHAALAGRVATLEHDHDLQALVADPLLELDELDLEPAQLREICLVLEGLSWRGGRPRGGAPAGMRRPSTIASLRGWIEVREVSSWPFAVSRSRVRRRTVAPGLAPRHALRFDVQVGSGPASHSVLKRSCAVDRREAKLARAGVGESVRLTGRADDHVAAIDDDRVVADLERRLAGLDHEHLGVWVAMELRADAGLRVHEDDRERSIVMLGADEFVGVLGVVQVVERDDRRHVPSLPACGCGFARVTIRPPTHRIGGPCVDEALRRHPPVQWRQPARHDRADESADHAEGQVEERVGVGGSRLRESSGRTRRTRRAPTAPPT